MWRYFAERGRFNRISHTAYIVVGILKYNNGKGVGTKFFENLDQWAKSNGIIRLELTVECCNDSAIHLYEKSGFKIEGNKNKINACRGDLCQRVLHGQNTMISVYSIWCEQLN